MTEQPPIRRNWNFWLLCAAYAVSVFGDHVAETSMMGVMGYAARTDPTDRLRLKCLLTVSLSLPFALLGPLNGLISDRLPRRLVMIAADLARCVLLVLTPLVWFTYIVHAPGASGESGLHLMADATRPYVQMIVPYLLIGLFAALFSPARAAMVPTLVNERELVQANASMGAAGLVFSGVGFAIGGWLAKAALGPSFFITSFTYFCSAACIFFVRVRGLPGASHAAAGADGEAIKKPSPGLTDGLWYILKHKRLIETLLFNTLFWGLVAVVMNGVVVGAKDTEDYGLVLGVFSFGMIAGAIIVNMIGRAVREAWTISWSLVGVGFFLAMYALTAPAEQVGDWGRAVRVGLSFGMGMFGIGAKISVETLLQRLTPDRLRGRVFGISDVLTMGCFLLVTVGLMIPKSAGQHLGAIFGGTAALVMGAGLLSVVVRYWRVRHRGTFAQFFWIHFFRVYCGWWHRAQRIGACRMPRTGPAIVVANHSSPLDPLLLITAIGERSVSFMVAEEQYRQPLFKYFCDVVKCIPVKRDGHDTSASRAAIRHLEAGGAMGIFPEGGIPYPDQPLPIKSGAATLALRTGAVILPAYICGVPYSDSITAPFWKRARAVVRFGAPINVKQDYAGREDAPNTADELTARLWAAVQALRAKAEHPPAA